MKKEFFVSPKEPIDRILAVTGQNTPVIFDVTKPEGASRESADVSKLRQVAGGFSPQIALDKGHLEMVEYFKNVFYINKIGDM